MAERGGRRHWYVPDGFLPARSSGEFESHEAVCLLNTGPVAAEVTLLAYFEDRDPLGPFVVRLPGRRTLHVRLDRLESVRGERIPRDVPYALELRSDVPIVVQHSRMDTSAGAMTLMTTMAYPEDE